MTDYVLHTLWSWHPMAGITLGRHVFLKKQFQGNQLLLAHELVHVRQMTEMGTLWYLLRYIFMLPLFWSPFRVRVEAEAYAVDAKAGCPIDGDKGLAAQIANWRYGWPCSRAKAAALIRGFMAALILVLAGPATAAEFSHVEVEQLLGQAVDEFSPTATLGLPYLPGTVAVSYVVDERPAFATVTVDVTIYLSNSP